MCLPVSRLFWVSSLAYPNLLGTKGYVVVVVVVVAEAPHNLVLLFHVQAAAIRIEIKGGYWRDAFMQMDGEPWKQPLSSEYSTFVDIKKVPYPSLIINGGDR
jgi:hypothetical protein